MGKKKFLVPVLAFGVMVPAMFMLSACGGNKDDSPEPPVHVHTYSEDWMKNSTDHWHCCTGEDCDETSGKAAHTFLYPDKTDDNHTAECSVCGYTSLDAHTWEVRYDKNTHWKECADCLKTKDDKAHVYDDENDLTCNDCDYTRTQTTLAFKTGVDYSAKTYNGSSQAFDKASLVDTNLSSLEDVVVEYSTTKADGSWIKEPKDAGTYYIRLSVEVDVSHTGCVVEGTETLTINQKELSLAELKWVYAKAQLTNGNHTVKLTHEDFSGVCGSDEIKLNMYIPAGTSFDEGSKWALKDQYDYNHTTGALTVTITNDDSTNNKNYKLSSKAVGELLVAKNVTTSGSGTTEAPYTYTVTETITKDQVVYYAAKLTRTNRRDVAEGNGFGDEYTLSLTSGVEIVDIIINNDEDIKVTINADGSVIMYGEEDTPTIIFAVKYTGESESISNTLTLTENIVTRTISAQLDLEKALRFSLGGGYKVVTKKNGSAIEEHKHQAFTGYTNYYQNYAGTEMYYTLIEGKDNYYIFGKNASGKWERSEVNVSENYENLNEVITELLKDSFAWINAIDTTVAFNTFTFSEEDLMYHTATRYNLNNSVMTTHIALKFEAGRLVYVEFTDGTDKYTVEVTNSAEGVTVDMPISGLFNDKATSVSYSTTDKKFLLEDVTLFKGDNWFEIEILDEAHGSSKVTGESYYILDGKFELTDSSSTTLTISAVNSSNGEVTNSVKSGIGSVNGAMKFKNLSAGKYYINISVTEDCAGDFSLEFLLRDI